jgi:hypothetical protein
MMRTRWLRQLTVHAAVFVLLLNAAVPMLASTAASPHGKAVSEICEVYGVRTVPATSRKGDHSNHGHRSGDAEAVEYGELMRCS